MIFVYGVAALLAAAITLLSVLVLKVGQARRTSKTPNCHYCGNQALRLSAPQGVTDRLLTYWNCSPYRCEICSRRQYRLDTLPNRDE